MEPQWVNTAVGVGGATPLCVSCWVPILGGSVSAYSSGGATVTTPATSGAGAYYPFTTNSLTTQSLTLSVAGIKGSSYIAQIIQNQVVLASVSMGSSGTYSLKFTPSSISLPLSLSITSMTATSGSVSITSVTYWHWVNNVVTITELVCNQPNDKYRFSFDGQEKTNEWAGVGNHYTAQFWEYDARVARRGAHQ